MSDVTMSHKLVTIPREAPWHPLQSDPPSSFWPRTRDWCLIEMFTPACSGSGSVELLGNHKPRHGLHNPCGRGWLSRVSWHYWGSLDIRDNDNTHATVIWERSTCVREVFILEMVDKTRLLLGMRLGWPCWDGPSIFFCVSRICRSHKLA